MAVFAVVCTQNLMGRAMWYLTTLSQLAFVEIEQRQALHGVSGWNDRPSAKDAAEKRAVSCCQRYCHRKRELHAGEAGFCLLESMDHRSLGCRTAQINPNIEIVTHQPPQCFVQLSAMVVGHSIVCSEYNTITNHSLVAEQDEKSER